MSQPKPYYIDQINQQSGSVKSVQPDKNFQVIQGGVSEDHSIYQFATFKTRFFAAIIDGALGNILAQVASTITINVFSKLLGQVGAMCLSFLVMFVVMWLYYVIPVAKTGQTLGKKLLRIKVIYDDQERSLSYATAFSREIIYKFISMIVVFGYFMPLFRRDKKALHDIFSRTKVIQL